MKKLFLASAIANTIKEFVKILPAPPNKLTVAFIPTAADPYEDKWFVDEDRNALKNKGFKIEEIDLKGKTEKELAEELKEIDIIFVAGGNSFYLLEKVIESSFDKVVRKLVDKGIIYVGSSAGAVLACPTIEPIKLLDDPSVAEDLKSFDGLNLVDFVVLPHYGKEKYKKKYEEIDKKYSNLGFKFIRLSDNQAIIVDGDDHLIVESC